MADTLLSGDRRRVLLSLAREAIAAHLTSRVPPMVHLPDLPAASGVFVTLKYGGTLRGCLGTLENRIGLAGEVVRCAVDAASRDPRFPPLASHELADITVELSVLGPLEPIAPLPDAFDIGVHGLVVEHRGRRGLLLPQVAVEWGWTAEQFLCQTCVKAGLAEDAWERGARIYRFAAEVFGE